MRYFTSDTHYFHEKLLGSNDFAPRPFTSVSEMHEVMVANWNQVVQAQDTVYHLGDIALHPEHEAGFAELLALLVRLQGKIAFIKGNHDTRTLSLSSKARSRNFRRAEVFFFGCRSVVKI